MRSEATSGEAGQMGDGVTDGSVFGIASTDGNRPS
jgi:hypothetical protein